jgi:hypothetical protein
VADMPKDEEIPQDINLCIEKEFGAPPTGPMTQEKTLEYIAEFHAHDVGKTQCGRRAIAWAEGHPTTLR